MREDPGHTVEEVSACLEACYGLNVASVAFLSVGHDPDAAVYRVVARDGASYFLKVRFGPVHEPSLLVPRALIEHGIRNVLAPLRTRSSELWCPLDGRHDHSLVLYPFVRGENAMVAGLSGNQWREFGRTMRAVHSSGLGGRLQGRLPVETFALPSAALVRRLLARVGATSFENPVAARFAAFWRRHAGPIDRMISRAEALGASLRSKPFEHVLCHADIHAANILVDEAGGIRLIDWDGPLVAPRERDLLFVGGSKIGRTVEPEEEGAFFEGYGPAEIDRDALVYFRYERIIEDIGEFGRSVFLDPGPDERARAEEAALVEGFFAPGGMVGLAETVAPVNPGVRISSHATGARSPG